MEPPMSPTPDTAILTSDQLDLVAQLSVLDARGQPVRFGTLYESQRLLVVLIRHFWCPNCRDYVSRLARIPVESFTAADIHLVVIGCGDPSMIKNYREVTGLQHAMFADPTRKLYDAVGARMIKEKATGPATYGHDAGIISSIRAIWKEPLLKPTIIGKQGKIDQLGVDMIIGPGPICSYTRRMKHAQDHTPVSELMAVAGVTVP